MTSKELLLKLYQEDPSTFQVLLDKLPESDRNNFRDMALSIDGTEPSERFTVHWADEALGERPPTPWVVDRLIKEATVSVLFGDGGVGKTWAMLDLAVCVSRGKPWLGHDTRQTTVLFVDEESGVDYMLERIAAVRRGHFHESEGLQVAFVSLAGLNLADEDDQQALKTLIVETSAGLVILDALADFMLGANENLVGDVQPIFNALRKIATATGAAVVIIHHANKMGGYRGSSAILGAIDLLLLQELNDRWVNYQIKKGRRGKKRKFYAVANFTENEAGDVIMFWMDEMDEPQQKETLPKSQRYVLRFLLANGPTEMPKIMANADVCTPETARHAVYALVEKGLAYRANPGEMGQGVAAVYELTKDGEEITRNELA